MQTLPIPAAPTLSKIPDFVEKSTSGNNFKEHLDTRDAAQDLRAERPDDAPAPERSRDDRDPRRETQADGRPQDAIENEKTASKSDDARQTENEGQENPAADDEHTSNESTDPADNDDTPETADGQTSNGGDQAQPPTGDAGFGQTVAANTSDLKTGTNAAGTTTPSSASAGDAPVQTNGAAPATPAVPSEGADAATRAVPAAPTTPATPAENTGPVAPANPATPAVAIQGDGPATPAVPATPATPTVASQGEGQTAPATPVIPNTEPTDTAINSNQNANSGSAIPATAAVPARGEGGTTPATPASPALAAQAAQSAAADAAAFDQGSSSSDNKGGSQGGTPQPATDAFGRNLPAAATATATASTATATGQPSSLSTQAAADVPQIAAAEAGDRLMALQGSNDAGNRTPVPQGGQTPAIAFGGEVRPVGDTTGITQSTYNAGARAEFQPATQQVAVQISRAVQDGNNRFTIELKPITMGRVTVHLEVGHDNRVIAILSAERPETLELLQRDSRALEKALQDAGLNTDSGSLSFSLEGHNGDDDAPTGPSSSGTSLYATDDEDAADPATAAGYAHHIGDDSIDIRV